MTWYILLPLSLAVFLFNVHTYIVKGNLLSEIGLVIGALAVLSAIYSAYKEQWKVKLP